MSDDAIKKALKEVADSMQSISQEISRSVKTVEEEIQKLIEEGARDDDPRFEKIRGFITESVDTVQNYQKKALEFAGFIKEQLTETFSGPDKEIDELTAKINELKSAIEKKKPADQKTP